MTANHLDFNGADRQMTAKPDSLKTMKGKIDSTGQLKKSVEILIRINGI